MKRLYGALVSSARDTCSIYYWTPAVFLRLHRRCSSCIRDAPAAPELQNSRTGPARVLYRYEIGLVWDSPSRSIIEFVENTPDVSHEGAPGFPEPARTSKDADRT